MRETYKNYMRVLSWLALFFLIAPHNVMSQDAGEGAPPAKFSKEELTQMLAPIALYPDSLLSQILMASTYPIEVVQAERWLKQNPNLKGDALDKVLKEKDWDVSVKSLCHYPDVLSAMSQNLDQTTKLGDAFLSQQKDVMDTIQELRAKAQAQGNLKTTEQQKVVVEQQYITIEPANPQVVYVPTYNTTAVYGPWWYPAYPPYAPWYYPAGAALVGGAIGFGIGYAVGSSWGWSDCDWGHGDIDVDINRTNNFNKVDIDKIKGGREKWQHNTNHRKGVAYRDKATSQRFGQSPKRSSTSKQARGYGDLGFEKQGFEKGGFGQEFKREEQKLGKEFKREEGKLGQEFKRGGSRESTFKGTGGRSRDSAFSGIGNGKSTRMASQRGYSSRGGGFGGGGRGGGRGGGGRRR
jgi:hypothetical protein